jgi:hypothetical protein
MAENPGVRLRADVTGVTTAGEVPCYALSNVPRTLQSDPNSGAATTLGRHARTTRMGTEFGCVLHGQCQGGSGCDGVLPAGGLWRDGFRRSAEQLLRRSVESRSHTAVSPVLLTDHVTDDAVAVAAVTTVASAHQAGLVVPGVSPQAPPGCNSILRI